MQEPNQYQTTVHVHHHLVPQNEATDIFEAFTRHDSTSCSFITEVAVAGLSTGKGIAPSSAPCPLWPLFRPENCGRNRDIVVVGGDEVLVLSTGNDASGMAASDPNFEKKPRFLAGWCGCCVVLLMLSLSSLSPTSSNVSDSSGVGGARSKWRGRSLNDALGIRGKRAESRLWRAPGSVILTGLLAEMSCQVEVKLATVPLACKLGGSGCCFRPAPERGAR